MAGPQKQEPLVPKTEVPPIPYDMIVIGSGPAGRRAAVQAAKFRKRVLVVERGRRVGGVSVHTGKIGRASCRERV